MSDRRPLMPKATAVWLVEHTSLTFDQIAAFCGLHVLEVKGIADGDVAQGIKGLDPVTSGQLTREEIETAELDPTHELHLAVPKVTVPETPAKKGPRYTPVSRRQDRPNAVLWILRNHPELKDSQIMRLVGTTKPTIAQIRDRSHWNAPNLTPQDPVTLGLCTQTDLDNEVKKGARRLDRERKDSQKGMEMAGTLLSTEETTSEAEQPRKVEIMQPKLAEQHEETPQEEQARVFAKLKQMKGIEEPAEEEPADEEPRRGRGRRGRARNRRARHGAGKEIAGAPAGVIGARDAMRPALSLSPGQSKPTARLGLRPGAPRSAASSRTPRAAATHSTAPPRGAPPAARAPAA